MTSHYKEVCQYGYVHGQCRCPSPNKTARRVACTLEVTHSAAPHYASAPPAPVLALADDEARMLTIGWLTSAANALTMGGSADDFAKLQLEHALALWDAL